MSPSALPRATTRLATWAATSTTWWRNLRPAAKEIQRLHQTQISRAEHFATLGRLAGLAHFVGKARLIEGQLPGVLDRTIDGFPNLFSVKDQVHYFNSDWIHASPLLYQLPTRPLDRT